ncbi:unnamed protein product [Absidia cylindrospora]
MDYGGGLNIEETRERKRQPQRCCLSLKKADLEFKVFKVESLPNDALELPRLSSSQLITRYLNAFVDDPKNGTLFRWRDTMNDEANKSSASISRRRPDSSISVFAGYSTDDSRGFEKVKSEKRKPMPTSLPPLERILYVLPKMLSMWTTWGRTTYYF